MSVGARTPDQQAPAIVHRKPARNGLVLSIPPQEFSDFTQSPVPARTSPWPASDVGAVTSAAIHMRRNTLHQRGDYPESP